MFNLIIPAQAAIFFNALMQVAAFDPIPADKTIDIWLNLETTGAYKPKFDILGFESMFCVSNMGTQAIILFNVFTILLVSSLLNCICSDRAKCVHRSKKRLDRIFKYRFFLRLMRELYIIFITCAALNLYYFKWETNGQRFCSLVALTLAIIVALYPFVIYYLILSNRKTLKSKKFEGSFGTIIDTLQFSGGRIKSMAIFSSYFYARRLILVSAIMWV